VPTVWKVHVKRGGYYLIPAKTEAAAKERAQELGASNITKAEPHVPRPWPDPEILAAQERRSEAAKERRRKATVRASAIA